MALLMVAPWAPQSEYGRLWAARLREAMPDIDLRHYPDELGDKAEIDAALAWLPPAGLLASLPNLKLIHSLGMGVDAVLSDPELPAGVPIARIVDADLIAALDSGQLSFAKLDVFREEPLAPDHPFWAHPKVRITPHNAGITNPATAVDQILENYRRALAGEPILNTVDPARGY